MPSAAVSRVLDRVGLVVLTGLGLLMGIGFAVTKVRPIDSNIFWTAAQSASHYGVTWGQGGAYFVYPPPIAQVLAVLPWQVFIVAWTTLLGLGWWAATRSWSLIVLVVSIAASVIVGFDSPLANPIVLTGIGNPQILIAAAIVVGIRYPAAWAFVVLTKIAPGIGLLWFVVRREWRALATAAGVTLVIAAASFVLDPGAWRDFVRFAAANARTLSPQPVVAVPLLLRILTAAALVMWGARTARPWVLPIAGGWASLALYEWSYVTVWIGALGLLRRPSPAMPSPPASTPPA